MRSRHLSQVIHRAPSKVYEYAAAPENLQSWAAGLAQGGIALDQDGTVRIESPMGPVRVRFVPRNALGVLDHHVTLPSGAEIYNPMRVLLHPEGAEVVFTLRQIDLSDDEFARDLAAVAADLRRLKAVLETPDYP